MLWHRTRSTSVHSFPRARSVVAHERQWPHRAGCGRLQSADSPRQGNLHADSRSGFRIRDLTGPEEFRDSNIVLGDAPIAASGGANPLNPEYFVGYRRLWQARCCSLTKVVIQLLSCFVMADCTRKMQPTKPATEFAWQVLCTRAGEMGCGERQSTADG